MKKDYTIRQILSESWEIFKDKWLFLFVISIVASAISFGFQFLLSFLTGILFEEDTLAFYLFAMAMFVPMSVFSFYLAAGKIHLTLLISKLKNPPIEELFSRKDVVLRYIGLSALVGLVYLLAFAVILAIIAVTAFLVRESFSEHMFSLSLIFLFLVCLYVFISVYLWIRLQFSLFILVDKNLGIVESLSKSFEITSGKFWFLYRWHLSIILLNIAGFFALFVGLIITLGVSEISRYVMYLKLIGYEKENSESEEIRELISSIQ